MSTQRRKNVLSRSSQQMAAADPTHSAWVAANAGTGKTHVLIDRITRLMLAGTAPPPPKWPTGFINASVNGP
jgi:ATP-dependent exoDNAse (exonuclease V) beta subunit